MATQAELVIRVLEELYVLEGGTTPDATADATVDKAIAEVHAELQERRLAYWDLSDIPEAVMRGLTLMVCGNVGRKFVPEMSVGECEDMRRAGMQRIREVIQMQNDHQPTPQTYF